MYACLREIFVTVMDLALSYYNLMLLLQVVLALSHQLQQT